MVQCDGNRPACTRCHRLRLPCQYDVTPGISRAERLKLNKQRQTAIINNLTALVDVLRSGSDLEATTVLARLRLGEPLKKVVLSLSDGIRELPENVQRCTITPDIYSPAEHAADARDLEPTTKYLAEPPTPNGDQDVTSKPTEWSISTTASQFLSAIFEREECRLPKTSLGDEENIHGHLITPIALPRAQHITSMALLQNIDNTRRSLLSEQGSPIHSTENAEDTLLASEVGRRFHGTWGSYPQIRNGVVTSSAFDIMQIADPRTISRRHRSAS
ncbi:hypothetical protein OPT61_g4530 [Boeremia exigua]|uniref:Uncharacterized protein n=1 Tax=Boeremia exigua TaxID=749465 RepID=A0ACC2IDY8_9PLEO|nr:hypothetical protein OPT61_g4530 [Boeremia exigua]